MFSIGFIAHLLSTYGYIGMFVITFLETSFFFPLPGDSLLFTTGVFASRGNINLVLAIICFYSGTFFGSLFGYYLGRKLEQIKEHRWARWIVNEKNLHIAHEYFEKKGKLTLLLYRFVPVVRTFVPMVAGAANMKFSTFVHYNLLGAAVWSVGVTVLGYWLGHKFAWIQDYLEYMIILIILVSVAPFFGKLSFFRRKKKEE